MNHILVIFFFIYVQISQVYFWFPSLFFGPTKTPQPGTVGGLLGFIPNYCIPGHVTEPATDCCTIYMSNPSAEEPLKTKDVGSWENLGPLESWLDQAVMTWTLRSIGISSAEFWGLLSPPKSTFHSAESFFCQHISRFKSESSLIHHFHVIRIPFFFRHILTSTMSRRVWWVHRPPAAVQWWETTGLWAQGGEDAKVCRGDLQVLGLVRWPFFWCFLHLLKKKTWKNMGEVGLKFKNIHSPWKNRFLFNGIP